MSAQQPARQHPRACNGRERGAYDAADFGFDPVTEVGYDTWVEPRPRLPIVWFGVMVAMEAVVSVWPTWVRASRACFSNFDLGIYSQAIAALSWANPNPWLSGRQLLLFNDHVDPILALAAPWTRLWPAVRVGLAVEALFAVLALLPLGWLYVERRLSAQGLWLLGAFLTLHVGVTNALGFPFHPTTWAMAPMLWLAAAIALDRPAATIVALVVLCACKEEFPFVGALVGPGLIALRRPRVGAVITVISVAWALFDFVLRPRWLGEVMPYAAKPFAGFDAGLGAFLSARLSVNALGGLGDWVVAFVPLVGWLAWKRRPFPAFSWVLLLPLLPMLAIRFLSGAWRDHYGAVLTAAAVGWLAAVLATTRLPRAVVALTVVLLLAGDERALRRLVFDVWGPVTTQAQGCPAIAERLESIERALAFARSAPGPLLVGGNLLPWLAERTDVYAIDGPSPVGVEPRTVVLEQPPHGDRWAVTPQRSAELIAASRARGLVAVIDDAFVYAATRP